MVPPADYRGGNMSTALMVGMLGRNLSRGLTDGESARGVDVYSDFVLAFVERDATEG